MFLTFDGRCRPPYLLPFDNIEHEENDLKLSNIWLFFPLLLIHCKVAFFIKRQQYSVKRIALFTVNFSHLHYNVFERGCEAISGTSTFKNIVLQRRKVNWEKGNWLDVAIVVIGFIALVATIHGESAHSLEGST